MQPYEVNIDLGSCCACGQTGASVRNVVMLHLRLPPEHRNRGTCWGCLVCGLVPPEGAIAVLCDECLIAKRKPNLVIVGLSSHNERMPIELLTEPYQHNESRHKGPREAWRLPWKLTSPSGYGCPN